MEDEIIDIFIVLGCLTIGVFGGIVLLLKYSDAIKMCACNCGKKKEDEPAIPPKRMTIKIARPQARVSPTQRPDHLTLGRTTSAPVPEIMRSPCSDGSSSFSSDIESGLRRQAVFILATAGKTYKATDAHSVLSAQNSSSTQSSYLPHQLHPLPKRRGSH
ncbi:hypothetical protein PMAYCL1PPCAC_21666 [Pristionchus mayeri]|uniref:Uncharacterized protein n=1 Tax=Pristionchus mayeri TaxID=1317129 RepID=A0AAN5CUZ1_9BILA|nr:hypothetical protein PMAYCL1PPCAC_21666 [Pristionchus mayeri]